MSELNSEFVKRGFWVNRARGSILGATLTTNTETGAIVVAILAVLTSLAMSHFWNLINFLWHQFRADGRPAEGLFRQQQALFRTLPSPGSSMTDSVKLLFAWKGKVESRGALGHSVLMTLVAFLFGLGTLAASIFSSYAVDGTNIEVLVSSPLCGLIYSGTSSPVALGERYLSKARDAGEKYAGECYQPGSATPTRCNVFSRPTIPLQVSTKDVPCPFSSKICTSSTVGYDTGLLDMNDVFGFNLNHNEGVKIRQKGRCAILSQEGRTRVVNNTDIPRHLTGTAEPLPQEQTLVFYLGSLANEQSDFRNATLGTSLFSNSRSRSFGIT